MKKFVVQKFTKFAVIASLCLAPLSHAKTIVSVDGVTISDSIFAGLKERNPQFNYDTLPEAQKTELLNELINGVITANAAKKDGLDQSEEYKMASLQLLSQLWLAKQTQNLAKTISVTDAEAEEFYKQNPKMFVTQNAEVRHILVAKEDQAKNLIAEIGKVPKTKTESKIAELAGKFSQDQGSKGNGGLMPLNMNDPRLAPEFTKAVLQMTAGTYTKTPVKTQFGYHIIYLKKLDKPVTQTFAQVKTQLIALLKQQKMQNIIEEKVKKMRDNAKIVYGK